MLKRDQHVRLIGLASRLAALVFLSGFLFSNCQAQQKQRVLGAGPSMVVAQLFFEAFSSQPAAAGYRFEVEPRSIKHAGGIQASGKYLFGRTGRPLDENERSQGKHDLFIARIPVAIVRGDKVAVRRMTLQQLEAVFTRKITNWRELGGMDAPILLAGREPTESVLSVMRHDYPFFDGVVFDQVLTRDHQLVNFIQSPKGATAIGFGARPNFDERSVIEVDDFHSAVSLGLVYDTKNIDHPTVKAAIEFARSETWRKRVIDSGLMPPE